MIFGIKTKKDKKIEELQKEIERLTYRPIKVTSVQKKVDLLQATACFKNLDVNTLPEGYVESILCKELSEKLKPYIKVGKIIDYAEDMVIYTGRLEVVIK